MHETVQGGDRGESRQGNKERKEEREKRERRKGREEAREREREEVEEREGERERLLAESGGELSYRVPSVYTLRSLQTEYSALDSTCLL